MSLFARAAGRGTRPRKSLKLKNITRGVGVKRYGGARIAGGVRLAGWKWLVGLGLGRPGCAVKAAT